MNDPAGFFQEIVSSLFAFLGVVIVGFISFFGGRGSVQAQLQAQLNDTMKIVIGELKTELEDSKGQICAVEARSAALEQYNISLSRILRDAGIPVPPPPKTETVFVLAPQMPSTTGT